MNKGYATIIVLMVLTVVITTVFIFILPESVPLHFNAAGEVDRVGSKFEIMLIPALGIGFGIALAIIARFGDKDNENVMIKLAIALQVLMMASETFLFVGMLSYDGTISSAFSGPDVTRFAVIAAGAFLVVLGNLMPKSSVNSLFGIRTPWSMSNDLVWQKTHRFGGYATITAGLLLVVLGAALSGFLAFVATVTVLIVWALVCLIASFKIYKDNPEW